jgi:dipeptidyl-peptidase-4
MHGSGDDNVHYHLGAERLVNALVQANKLFTFQPYPNRTHGIAEGENTSLHVREVMTKFLEDHMPPGPNPVSSSAPPAPSPPFP